MGTDELAVIKQRITTLKQLFTRKETRVLAATCTGESIAKDMLNDMDEKVTEIIELMGKIVANSNTADARVTEESMKKIDDEMCCRQIHCEAHVAALPSSLLGFRYQSGNFVTTHEQVLQLVQLPVHHHQLSSVTISQVL